MKKWLLMAAVAAAAALVAKKLLLAQKSREADIVTNVIYDDATAPVQSGEPASAVAAPSSESAGDMSAETPSENENS